MRNKLQKQVKSRPTFRSYSRSEFVSMYTHTIPETAFLTFKGGRYCSAFTSIMIVFITSTYFPSYAHGVSHLILHCILESYGLVEDTTPFDLFRYMRCV